MPIRLTILTGFLGAGKTTLLNRLLAETDVTNVAVVVNEFGEAGIDPLLVETTITDGIVELANGCVCCSVRGELVSALADLANRQRPDGRGPLKRVIVETSGLSDPGPIIAALMTDATLLDRFVLDGVVALVDRVNGAETIATRREAQRQVAVADRIVLTKSDLAPSHTSDALDEAIAALNPRAPRIDGATSSRLATAIFDCGLVDTRTGRPDLSRWIGTTEHAGAAAAAHLSHGHGEGERHGRDRHRHGTIRSFSIVRDEPISFEAVTAFLDLLNATQGDRLLRMKAIVQSVETPDQPIVLHGVRGFLHPPARLGRWPDDAPRQTRLVLIGDGLSEAYARDLFSAFTGGLRIDAPDRVALEANPLAVAGHTFR